MTGLIKKLLITSLLLAVVEATQGQTIQQVQAQLRTAQHDTIRLRLYLSLADLCFEKKLCSPFHAAISKALPLAVKSNSTLSTARLYYLLGMYHRSQGRFSEALKMLQKSVQLFERLSDKQHLRKPLYNLNITYIDSGNLQQALKQALTNLAFFEKHEIATGVMITYWLLSDIYKELGNKLLMQFYAHKYFQMARQSERLGNRIAAFNLKAAIYEDKGDFFRAFYYHKQGLKYARTLNVPYFLIASLRDVAANLRNQNLPAKAHVYLKEAIKLSVKHKNESQLALSWRELALTHLKQNRKEQAYRAGQKAVQFIKQSGFTMEIMKALEISADLQQATGHYQEALLTYREYNQLKDSLFSLGKAKAIGQLQSTYELKKKENTILLLNKTAQLQGLKTARQTHQLRLAEEQRQKLVISISALVLLVGVVGFFWYKTYLTQRQLAQQKLEIERQATELQQASQLKDRLFSTVGHDLRSPITSLHYLIQQVQQTNQHAPTWPTLLTQLADQVTQLSRLVNNLLYWSLAQQGLLTDRSQWLSLPQLLAECESLFGGIIRHKALQMEITALPQQVWADENQLQLIVRNLLDNAIKFSPWGSSIQVEAMSEAAGFGLLVTNQVAPQAQTLEGANLGLKTIAGLLERHAGTLAIEQSDTQTWRVHIHWPAPSPIMTYAETH